MTVMQRLIYATIEKIFFWGEGVSKETDQNRKLEQGNRPKSET